MAQPQHQTTWEGEFDALFLGENGEVSGVNPGSIKQFIHATITREREEDAQKLREGLERLGYSDSPYGKLIRGQDVLDLINSLYPLKS